MVGSSLADLRRTDLLRSVRLPPGGDPHGEERNGGFRYQGTVADRVLLLAISLPITLAVAGVSYRWFEQRFAALRTALAP